ncbi:MAG TPA: MFS transporter [Allosphingosinicella sp.]|nr:MFS transporter [Allosphingosinicella sp.]
MTAPPEPAPAEAPANPFRIPLYRNVWIANFASQFGGMIQTVGASWMMVSFTASPVMVSLVQASTSLPILAFALIAGALADIFDRRLVMIAAQIFMLAASTLLTLFALFGLLTPWLLLVFTFLIGAGAAFNLPARQASVGEMVPRSLLGPAIAFNSMGFNLSRSAGPALGGAIVALASATAAFAANALSYVGLLVVLLRWRPPAEPRTLPRESLGSAIVAGLRYAAMSPSILSVLARGAAFGLTASALASLLPLIARERLDGSAAVFGLLLGAFGLGAVVGAYFSIALRRKFSAEAIVRLALVLFAAAAACSALSHMLPLTLITQFVAGAGWILVLSTFNTTVQMAAPRWVVARALALYQTVTFGCMALSAWLWGTVAAQHGLVTAVLASSAAVLGCAALGLLFPLPRVEALNLDPLGRWTEPSIPGSIEPKSGPVSISIEYRIREADQAAFLAVMAERRRIRRRDGARRWSLLRSLEDPELWYERYETATWAEYVRHNRRVTHADADIGARLREMHQGDRPHVRRMIAHQDLSEAADRYTSRPVDEDSV